MADVALRTQHSDIWWVFLLQGLAGIVLGIMLLTEPAATLVAPTTLLGFYWLTTGILARAHGPRLVDPLDRIDTPPR